MIFVTVGTQEAFPRLIWEMNRIAEELDEEIVAQTLDWELWPNLSTMHSISEDAYEALCRRARCIVGHAGIGTYLAAKRFEKPLICLPRRKHLKEHRSDHQWDTAQALMHRAGVQVVENEREIGGALSLASVAVSGEPEGYEQLLSELARLVA